MDFAVVDAFTSVPFRGNPAAVIVLAGDAFPDDELLTKIAAEFNLSETAFLLPKPLDKADDGSPLYHLRWFTPNMEYELCGHATLASSHILFSRLPTPSPPRTRFTTLSGILSAKLVDSSSSKSRVISLDFPANPPKACDDAVMLRHVERATGISRNRFLYVGADALYYVIEVPPEEDVERLKVDVEELAKVPDEARHLSLTPRPDFISRVFCPKSGVDEDPVTGSAHCVLAVHYGLKLKRFVGNKDAAATSMIARQVSSRIGELEVQWDKEGRRVMLQGTCVTVSEGHMLI